MVNNSTKQLNKTVTGRQRTNREISNANLKPFKKGQSGNPNGRTPGKKVVSEWIRGILSEIPDNQLEGMTRGELLARSVIAQATKGDMRAVEIALDRGEGKVTQPIGGDRESPIYLINVSSEEGKGNIKRVMEGDRT